MTVRYLPQYPPTHYGGKEKALGTGAYGTVFLSSSGFAIKKISITQAQSAMVEIACMLKLIHPNVVALEDAYIGDKYIFIVMEYLDLDLKQYRDSTGKPSKPLVRSVYQQIIRGLNYIHSRGIIHCDIKPNNILITKNGIVKIADFGISISSTCSVISDKPVFTLWYRSPELLLGGKLTYKSDIWASGCVIVEFITGRTLFAANTEIETLFKIFRLCGTPNVGYWPEAMTYPYWIEFPKWLLPKNILNSLFDFGDALVYQRWESSISSMFTLDPNSRITTTALLEDPILKDSKYTVESACDCIGTTDNILNSAISLIGERSKIPNKHRTRVLNNILLLHRKYKYTTRSYFLTSYYIDKLEALKEYTKKDYSIMAGAAHILALMFMEVDSDDAIEKLYGANNKEYVLAEVYELVRILGFDLIAGLSVDYLHEYGKFYDERVEKYAIEALVYLTGTEWAIGQKEMCLAAINLACRYFGVTFKHLSLLEDTINIEDISDEVLEKIAENMAGYI